MRAFSQVQTVCIVIVIVKHRSHPGAKIRLVRQLVHHVMVGAPVRIVAQHHQAVHPPGLAQVNLKVLFARAQVSQGIGVMVNGSNQVTGSGIAGRNRSRARAVTGPVHLHLNQVIIVVHRIAPGPQPHIATRNRREQHLLAGAALHILCIRPHAPPQGIVRIVVEHNGRIVEAAVVGHLEDHIVVGARIMESMPHRQAVDIIPTPQVQDRVVTRQGGNLVGARRNHPIGDPAGLAGRYAA